MGRPAADARVEGWWSHGACSLVHGAAPQVRLRVRIAHRRGRDHALGLPGLVLARLVVAQMADVALDTSRTWPLLPTPTASPSGQQLLGLGDQYFKPSTGNERGYIRDHTSYASDKTQATWLATCSNGQPVNGERMRSYNIPLQGPPRGAVCCTARHERREQPIAGQGASGAQWK